MRKWWSGMAVLAMGIPVMSQGPGEAKKTPESVPARQGGSADLIEAQKKFAALKKEAEEWELNTRKAQRMIGETDRLKSRQDSFKKSAETRGSFAVKAMEMAKVYPPTDPLAFEPLFFAMQNGFAARKNALVDEAKELLLKNYLDHPQFGKVITFVMSTSQSIDLRFSEIGKIAKEAKSASTKGQAYFALGLTHQSVAAILAARDAKASDEHLKSAKEYFEIVIKDYPEIETPGGKVGALARARLSEMNLNPGRAAPSATCLNIDGNKQDQLSHYKGKVVMLNFWSTAPPPIPPAFAQEKERVEAMFSQQNLAAIAQKKELIEKLKGKSFVLISVNADEKRETLDKFLEKNKMPWIQWYAGPSGITLDWGVRRFPTTYIIDHKGVIRAKDLRGKPLEAKIAELLAELETNPQG